MMQPTRYLGMDAHKVSIAVAVFGDQGPAEEQTQVPNQPGSVSKLVRRLGGEGVRLAAAYEAGPTGYALHRQHTALGVECVVVAPSLIPSRPGDRVKTDRRDSEKLGRLLRSGDLIPITRRWPARRWSTWRHHEEYVDEPRRRPQGSEEVPLASRRTNTASNLASAS